MVLFVLGIDISTNRILFRFRFFLNLLKHFKQEIKVIKSNIFLMFVKEVTGTSYNK